MLGLMRGRFFDALWLILPRFLFVLPPLPSFLSFKITAGVVAEVAEDGPTAGLGSADGGRALEGVLVASSFGVLRADRRGVSASSSIGVICVLIRAGAGGRAASGSARSSSPPHSPEGCETCGLLLDPLASCCVPRRCSSDFGVAAAPVAGAANDCCSAELVAWTSVDPGRGGGPIKLSLKGSGLMLSAPELS